MFKTSVSQNPGPKDLDLIDYVKKNNMGTGIRLSIGLHKTIPDRNMNGRDARYLKCFIGDKDVTEKVAELCGFKLSNTSKTNGCLIVKGSGTDVGFFVQNRVSQIASNKGEPDMFSKSDDYIYLGKFKNGAYSYDNRKRTDSMHR